MNSIIVFVALFAVALAAPPAAKDAVLLKSESDVQPDGFNYNYELSDGSQAQAQGTLKNAGTEDEALVVRGSFQFVGDDGLTYAITYVADENGYQPQGAHLPVAPVA